MGSLTGRQNWTFLTNHARVLVTIARDPAARLRDVALACALTERTVQTIVADLESDGYLQRVRDGRRNRYEISAGAVFKHPAEAGVQVAGLLALLTGVPAADPEPGHARADGEGEGALESDTGSDPDSGADPALERLADAAPLAADGPGGAAPGASA
ncbi:helix-turn-helix transcriptional regulator [Streptomyces sp. NPDC002032]|uniref:helix-turn-helix transcriptional regulator n=1 Tax=Streptomyces sp. NPDC002032 TaxID=3364630 RepID=UPI003699F310